MSKISHDYKYKLLLTSNTCKQEKCKQICDVSDSVSCEEEEEVKEDDLNNIRIRYPTFSSVFGRLMKPTATGEVEEPESEPEMVEDCDDGIDYQQQFGFWMSNGFVYKEAIDARSFKEMYHNVRLKGRRRFDEIENVSQNVFELNVTMPTSRPPNRKVYMPSDENNKDNYRSENKRKVNRQNANQSKRFFLKVPNPFQI